MVMASSSNNHSHQELNLPQGFTFNPTDSELIEFYLIPKLNGQKLPSDYVVDLDNVFEYDPHQLPYKLKYAKENEAFFFTKDEMWKRWGDGEGGREGEIRATPGGYWKVYKDDVNIKGSDEEVIGFKTKLFFHDNADGNLTDWKMNEFRCHPTRIPTTSTSMENYIACKIKLRSKNVETTMDGSSDDDNRSNGGNL